MGKRKRSIRISIESVDNIDEDSDGDLEVATVSVPTTKKYRYATVPKYLNGNGNDSSPFNGKCCICTAENKSTYPCIKCKRYFHIGCDSFKMDNENCGICGTCLMSVLLECPCCHQRCFKGIHGLRTHIGGYCRKQHSKDWREHFKDFFAQLEKKLEGIRVSDVSALSILKAHLDAAHSIACQYGEESEKLPSASWYDHCNLREIIETLCQTNGGKVRKNSRVNENKEKVIKEPSRYRNERIEYDDVTPSNYNLRKKISQKGQEEETVKNVVQTAPQPPKEIPSNAFLDCQFCGKVALSGLSGLRTHIRNYCLRVDKEKWREMYLKCILFNIKKYEKNLAKEGDDRVTYNNAIISVLKEKVQRIEAGTPVVKPLVVTDREEPSFSVPENEEMVDGSIIIESFDRVVFCKDCQDENDYCAACGCYTCHYKHLASMLLICDKCNREHHLYCITPRMKTIPDGSWYCPDCQEPNTQASIYKDRNAVDGWNELSESVQEVVKALYMAIKDKSDYSSIIGSLNTIQLLELQTCKMV